MMTDSSCQPFDPITLKKDDKKLKIILSYLLTKIGFKVTR